MHEYKAVPVSNILATEEDEAGVVEALVAVTGIKDNVNDIIEPGAFAKTLIVRKPKGVWHHNITESVARTEDVKELLPGDSRLPKSLANGEPWPSNAGGLLVKTRFNMATQRGRDAYEDVKFFGSDQEWCVDESTEILTQRGWLRYDEIADEDHAYVLDPQFGSGHFEQIEAVNVFPEKTRRMRHIETGGFDALTTAAHRWPLNSNIEGGHAQWSTTDKLDYRSRITRAAKRSDYPLEAKYSDSFVELVAWYWTEGWNPPADHADAGLYIAQSMAKNPQHVASIRSALQDAVPGQWSERHSKDDMARFRMTREAASAFHAVTGEHKQPTPEFLTDLTKSQLVLFIDTCMSGDGHEVKTGQRTWYQVEDDSVRAFEMACALAGIPTVTSQPKDYGNRYGCVPQNVSLLKSGVSKPLDAVRVKSYNTKSRRTVARDEWVEHTGIVWCPTTPSGTWMMRRNGKVCFTGNSIGYNVPVGGAVIDKKTGTRNIKQLDLWEYSPVLFGAMPNARTMSVKSAQSMWASITGEHALELKSMFADAASNEQELEEKSRRDPEADSGKPRRSPNRGKTGGSAKPGEHQARRPVGKRPGNGPEAAPGKRSAGGGRRVASRAGAIRYRREIGELIGDYGVTTKPKKERSKRGGSAGGGKGSGSSGSASPKGNKIDTNKKPRLGGSGRMEEDESPYSGANGGKLVSFENGIATYDDGSFTDGSAWYSNGKRKAAGNNKYKNSRPYETTKKPRKDVGAGTSGKMEEDEAPDSGAAGGKLVDYSGGVAYYDDGTFTDGNKWYRATGKKGYDMTGIETKEDWAELDVKEAPEEDEDLDDEDWEDEEDDEDDSVESKSIVITAEGLGALDDAIGALSTLRTQFVKALVTERETKGSGLAGLAENCGLDIADLASKFDAAVADEDPDTMEDAAEQILDMIDDAVDGADEEQMAELKHIGQYIADSFQEFEAEEPTEEKGGAPVDSEDDEEDEEEDAETGGTKTATVHLDVKSILDLIG